MTAGSNQPLQVQWNSSSVTQKYMQTAGSNVHGSRTLERFSSCQGSNRLEGATPEQLQGESAGAHIDYEAF